MGLALCTILGREGRGLNWDHEHLSWAGTHLLQVQRDPTSDAVSLLLYRENLVVNGGLVHHLGLPDTTHHTMPWHTIPCHVIPDQTMPGHTTQHVTVPAHVERADYKGLCPSSVPHIICYETFSKLLNPSQSLFTYLPTSHANIRHL